MAVNIASAMICGGPHDTLSLAQEKADDQERAEAALKLTREYAGRYEFFLPSSAIACRLEAQPILRWSNPERGEIYGNVYLWTHQGYPVAVGSLYKWYSPFTHMSHEFHSLSTQGLRAAYDGKEAWKTDQAGLKFQELPDAPDVAATAPARLIQMRQLARRFTATSTDEEGSLTNLRLLSQPVYRYVLPDKIADGEDGALFSFVQGTDPEIWLLLQSRPFTKAATPRWSFALARMNSIAMVVQDRGTEVWRAPAMPHREFANHIGPYTKFSVNNP